MAKAGKPFWPAACILAMAIAIMLLLIFPRQKNISAAATPREVICWRTDGAEYEGYTPAQLIEAMGLHDMAHKTGTTQLCSGWIDNHLVQFEAGQIWIRRAP